MATNPPQQAKSPPQPTKASRKVAEYFELQLIDIAIKSYKEKQYLKSALMSWSFLEEFFLPTQIKFIAQKQKIALESDIFKASVTHLVRYYYLISYDEEMYDILCTAARLRNALIHKNYRSGSIKEIAKRAQESAKYNLFTAFEPMGDRLSGKIVSPSLLLYSNGWNDYRTKTIEVLNARKRELEGEIKLANSHT